MVFEGFGNANVVVFETMKVFIFFFCPFVDDVSSAAVLVMETRVAVEVFVDVFEGEIRGSVNFEDDIGVFWCDGSKKIGFFPS